jgi:hypothetical protein
MQVYIDQRIIDYVQNIKDTIQSHFWNEHRLRAIARMPKEKQFERFKQLCS